MKPNRGQRRRGRLVALAAALGALWLAVGRPDLSRMQNTLSTLLSSPPLVSLLEDRLPGTQEEEPLEALVLDQLPQPEEAPPVSASTPGTSQPDGEEAEEPAQASPDPSQPVPEEEPVLPTSGLLEAPESDPWVPEEPAQDLFADFSHSVSPSDLEITNSTGTLDVNLGDYLERDLPLTLSQEGPQILIMHTHATEAYTMADGDNYTPSDNSRTTDENYNMVRVGEEIKAVFESLGLSVIHDTSLYDYPSYTSSYARSLEGIQSYLEEYPTISVVLDVHRDALIDADGTVYKLTHTLDSGETAAQVMLVLGTDAGGLEHPNWEDNLTVAAHIQASMMALDPDFPRKLNLRSQRFNQHMTTGSLLVEVGTSGNTLQEALAGARAFARAAGRVYLECLDSSDS